MEIAFKQAYENVQNFINNRPLKNIVQREEYVKIDRNNIGV